MESDGQAGTHRCVRHPGAPAGWECSGCHSKLCPDCTAVRRTGTSQLFVCCCCGDMARPITIERASVPFLHRVLDAPLFPLKPPGLVALAMLSVFLAFMSYFRSSFAPPMARWFVFLVYYGTFWAYMLYIIRSTGAGTTRMAVPEFRDIRTDLFGPALKGIAATAMIWVPAVAYAFAVRQWGLTDFLALAPLRDPIFWALILLGVVYAPMALLAAATDIELGGMLNPIRIFTYIRRMGWPYFGAVAALIVLAVAGAIVDSFIVPHLMAIPIPFVCRILATAAGLWAPFVMVRVLGLLLHVYGWHLDWGDRSEYADPVLRGVAPRGSAVAPRARETSGPLLVSTAVPSAPAAFLDARSLLDGVAGQVATALDGYDLGTALAVYGAHREIAGLPPEYHFRIGQAAVDEGQTSVAVRALKTAGFSQHVVAPDALLALGQLYEERLADPMSACRLYREVSRKFPASSAAPEAARRLSLLE